MEKKENWQTRIIKKSKKNNGITIVALAVTIIVILILATISITALSGENGILKQARERKKNTESDVKQNEKEINKIFGEYTNAMAVKPVPPEVPKGPNGKPLIGTVTDTNHDTIIAEDKNGNQVVVPGGFKTSEDSGETVKEGIVIEDKNENQFVWIPVSNINGDGINTIKIEDETGTTKEIEIVLGRYTFNTTTGAEKTLVQKGSEYEGTDKKYTVSNYYQELNISRESNYDASKNGENATANNLGKFIRSVEINKGYYLARYEASCGDEGTTLAKAITDKQLLSKKSTSYNTTSTSSINYKPGTLWNSINQGDASKVCRKMYKGSKYLESDLTNSYAWDTAICYIQAMGNGNYANANSTTNGNYNTLKNTGDTGDEKCHIFDMAGNTREWTTEYTTIANTSNAFPCNVRGGNYSSSTNYTSSRYFGGTASGDKSISFRPILYINYEG